MSKRISDLLGFGSLVVAFGLVVIAHQADDPIAFVINVMVAILAAGLGGAVLALAHLPPREL